MRRSRFILSLFSSGLALVAACGDAVAPRSPSSSTPISPAQPITITLTGLVHPSEVDLYPAVLTTTDGQDIPLAGQNANILASLENAGVAVRGQWDAEAAFLVNDFLVLTVGGGKVIDGVLVALYDVASDIDEVIGYGVSPTQGGAPIRLTDAPADLLAHLNQRVWVALDDGTGAATAFGVIQNMYN
jgi:hypothetical protein